MTDSLRQTPQVIMADINRLYSSAFYRQLRSEGINLSRTQWRVIAVLRVKDGLSQTELAEYMWMEKAPLGVLLDKLEEKHLIERRPDSSDRRVKRVYITPTAGPLIPILEKASDDLLAVATRGMSEKDKSSLITMLDAMRNNLGAGRDSNS